MLQRSATYAHGSGKMGGTYSQHSRANSAAQDEIAALKGCLPVLKVPIDWESERSVESYSALHTLENAAFHARTGQHNHARLAAQRRAALAKAVCRGPTRAERRVWISKSECATIPSHTWGAGCCSSWIEDEEAEDLDSSFSSQTRRPPVRLSAKVDGSMLKADGSRAAMPVPVLRRAADGVRAETVLALGSGWQCAQPAGGKPWLRSKPTGLARSEPGESAACAKAAPSLDSTEHSLCNTVPARPANADAESPEDGWWAEVVADSARASPILETKADVGAAAPGASEADDCVAEAEQDADFWTDLDASVEQDADLDASVICGLLTSGVTPARAVAVTDGSDCDADVAGSERKHSHRHTAAEEPCGRALRLSERVSE